MLSRGEVPGRFGAGSEPRSEPQVPGRFRGRFRTTASRKVFRTTFRNTGSRKVPGQVPNHGFQETSLGSSEPRISGQVLGDRVPLGRFQNSSGQVSRL